MEGDPYYVKMVSSFQNWVTLFQPADIFLDYLSLSPDPSRLIFTR